MSRLTNTEENRKGTEPFSYWLKDSHPLEQLKAFKKLADYEDKEEQGLLIELPCKVGDKVYLADKIHGKVEVSIVEHIEYIVNTNANFPFTKIKGEGFCIFFDDFEKLGFLTRSEAEEALAKMKGK